MHAILDRFLTQIRAQNFIAKYEAAEAAAPTDGVVVSQNLVDDAIHYANVPATAPQTRDEAPAFEPNRAQRRHAAKNPTPVNGVMPKKVRLGGYGRMVQSYFEQKRGLERDEKRLAAHNRAIAALQPQTA